MEVKIGKMNRFSLLFCLAAYLLVGTDAALDAEGIVGGEISSPGEYSYQISLERAGQSFCGGSIIGDQYVLTAAHCVTDKRAAFTTFAKKVVAGAYDLDNKGRKAITVDVEKVYIPREYGVSDTVGDIAVLKLKQPLGLKDNKHLSKLELPEEFETYAGEEATITGYGWTWVRVHKDAYTGEKSETGGGDTLKIKFAVTDVLTNAKCQRSYSQTISNKQICAQVRQRYRSKTEGVCSGDSGGPLVYEDNVIIGTVSTSPIGCNESIAPGIYTRVSSYLDFINNAIADRVTSTMRVYDHYPKSSYYYPSLPKPTARPQFSWSDIFG